MNIKKPKLRKQYRLFVRFASFILPYRGAWFLILLLSYLVSLLGLINPYLTRLFIDRAVGTRDLRLFGILVLVGAAVFMAISILGRINQYMEKYVRTKIRIDLNKHIFGRLIGLPFRWFQENNTGANIYKISYDIGRAEDLITTVPPQAVSLFPKMVFILVIIFSMNWRMALLASCLAPALYIPAYYFNRRRVAIWESLIKNSENIFKILHEIFSHILPIKIFGKEKKETARYIQALDNNIKIERDSFKLELFNGFVASLVNKAIIGIITLYGAYQVIVGSMTLGTLTAIMVYVSQLVAMQSSFIGFFQTIVLGVVSCQRLADILDERCQLPDTAKGGKPLFRKADIVFNRVTFGYLSDRPVLKDLCFSIENNRHVCLVGRSGCGKTTILNLMLRLYEPWDGEIAIGGYKIQDIEWEALRTQIGMALQEPFLFNDSIKNNIAFGKENAVEPEIIEAAKISLAHDFIEKIPGKYESVIGENACKLSEGQKQKIAIARAVIKKPKILILDEAMSSMDSASEESILANIKENFKEMTLITVSHRLSTVMNSDIVYFLKGPGEMVAGRYEELIVRDKDFYDLFKAQLIESTTLTPSQG